MSNGLVAGLTVAATPRTGTLSAPLTDAATAAELLRGRRVVALTGAGMSTDSGIPDYRGPGSPSTFCVIRSASTPAASSAATARCPLFGLAWPRRCQPM